MTVEVELAVLVADVVAVAVRSVNEAIAESVVDTFDDAETVTDSLDDDEAVADRLADAEKVA